MTFLQIHAFNIVTGLSVLVVFGQLIMVAILGASAIKSSALSSWVSRHGLTLMFIVALVATIGSLYFSEIALWAPCKYCWIQRILMYPQVVLLGIALWQKDRNVAKYVLALSIIGALYAAYHYYIQMYDIIASPANPATPCDASGESCVKTPFTEFGYITIPMMALTAFLLNIVGSTVMMKRKI